jgi:hypothetical protein
MELHEAVLRGVGMSAVQNRVQRGMRGIAARKKTYQLRLRVARLDTQGVAVKDIASQMQVSTGCIYKLLRDARNPATKTPKALHV